MKKIVSIILIVSMIFTTSGFATLADSVSDVIETTNMIDDTDIIHKYHDDIVGADTENVGADNENVGADTIRPNDGANDNTVGANTENVGADIENVGADIIRPNDGANDNTVGADTKNVGADTENVGADIIRPNDSVNDNTEGADTENVGADIIRPSANVDLLSTNSDIEDESEEDNIGDYAEEPEEDLIETQNEELETDIPIGKETDNKESESTKNEKLDEVETSVVESKETFESDEKLDVVESSENIVETNTTVDESKYSSIENEEIIATDSDTTKENSDEEDDFLEVIVKISTDSDIVSDSDYVEVATIIEYQNDVATQSELILDDENVSLATISDTIELNEATPSDIYELNIDLSTQSEIIDTKLATLSEITVLIASDSDLFGSFPNVYGKIFFGAYPQSSTNYDAVEPIKWVVLDKNDKEVYLMADRILDWNIKFNDTMRGDISFENSTIRTWLNNDFYNKAFQYDGEKEAIVLKEITSVGYFDHKVTSKDYIYMMTADEWKYHRYWRNHWMSTTKTNYSKSKDWTNRNWYWTRTMFWRHQVLVDVGDNEITQTVSEINPAINTSGIGVRPVFTASVSAPIFNAVESNITWNLGGREFLDDSTWKEYTKYKEGFPILLPVADNFKDSYVNEAVAWTIKDSDGNIVCTYATELPADLTGDIELEATFGEEHNIIWDMGGGHVTVATRSTFIHNFGYELPDSSEVVPPEKCAFDHWEVNGVPDVVVASDLNWDVEVKAIYRMGPGATVFFGTYPQSSTNYDIVEPIKWRILNNSGEEMLLVTDKIIDKSPYDIQSAYPLIDVTYEEADIRQWLNNDFYNKAFPTLDEKTNIIEKEIVTTGHRDGPVTTKDKVFLLSRDDMLNESYGFVDNESRKATRSIYAKSLLDDQKYYWLRTHGDRYKAVGLYVTDAGIVGQPDYSGVDMNIPLGIRPALYSYYWNSIFDLPEHNITWDLGTYEFHPDSTWREYNTYRETLPIKLPVAGNFINAPAGATVYWTIKDSDGNIIHPYATELTSDLYEDIIITPHFENTYNVTFDMAGGSLTIATPSFYMTEVGLQLPDSTEVRPPQLKNFDHWEIDGIATTSIVVGSTGDKVVRASYSNVGVGDTIFFGQFPQSVKNDNALEPIKWRILSNDGNEMLLLSDKMIATRQYNTDWRGYEDLSRNWADSTLRNWLNNDFYNKAFMQGEGKETINGKVIVNNDGTSSYDKIFLLSHADMRNTSYGFTDSDDADSSRAASGTNYAGSPFRYWLRDVLQPYGYCAYVVEADGSITSDFALKANNYGVRPALYVSATASYFTAKESKIYWHLGYCDFYDDSTWRETFTYKEGMCLRLPTIGALKDTPEGSSIVKWDVMDDQQNILYEMVETLPRDLTGDIILKPHFGYDLTYDMDEAYLTEIVETYYMTDEGYSLPASTSIVSSQFKIFDHWEINGVTTDSIAIGETGAKVAKAIFKMINGETIFFGTYPQSSTYSNIVEPIKWKILNATGSEALLLTDKLIDYNVKFNDTYEEITWETATIRPWLNKDFYKKAFLYDSEKKSIKEKEVVTTYTRGGIGDVVTKDKIFLLSREDVTNPSYGFTNDDTRKAVRTNYSISKGSSTGHDDYFIRSPEPLYPLPGYVYYVSRTGYVEDLTQVNHTDMGIRPALYVDIASSLFTAVEHKLTWELGALEFLPESTWREINTYREGMPLKLPAAGNLRNAPDGSTLYWQMQDADGNVIHVYDKITELPTDIFEDIKLAPRFAYKMSFDMGGGSLYNLTPPPAYMIDEGYTLPDRNIVVPPKDREFDHWEIDGIPATEIPVGSTGDKVIKAVYRVDNSKVIFFGTYPQSSTDYDIVDPIMWKILKSSGSETLLLADKKLDISCYYEGRSFADWKKSNVRSKLNGKFYNKAFISQEEKDSIINKEIVTSGYAGLGYSYDTVVTNDNVFVLSLNEITDPSYGFTDDESRKATGTKYYSSLKYFVVKNYWLRTPWNTERTYVVDSEDGDFTYGYSHWYVSHGIRPALYIDTSSLLFTATESIIYWDLGSHDFLEDSTWKLYDRYREGMPLKLPTVGNIAGTTSQDAIYWSIEDTSGNVLYDSVSEIPTDVRGDIRLVLHIGYKVSFDMGEGHLTIATPSYYLTSLGLTLPASSVVVPPNRYDFVRWEINGIATTSIPAGSTGDKVVKAIYRGETYTILYVENGGTIPSGHALISKIYGQPVTLEIPYKVGYEFGGWYSDSEYKNLYDGTTDLSLQPGLLDTLIYAKWNPVTYTIRYNTDGGTLPTRASNSFIKSYGESVDLMMPKKIGYRFDGWYSDSGLTTLYDGTTDLSTTQDDTKDIYAKWTLLTTPLTYTIRYVTNGGTLPSTASPSFTKTYNTDVTLASPSKIGYEFAGWFSDNRLTNIYDGTTDLSTTQDDTKDIYAKWNPRSYTIRYNTDGGTLPTEVADSFTKTYGESVDLASPSKIGHVFAGWYSDSGLTNRYYGNTDLSTVSTVTKDIYAKWDYATYTIRYNVNDGDLPSGINDTFIKTYGTDVTLANPTKMGYRFDGWYREAELINRYYGNTDLSTVSNATKNIYAKWNPVTYTISYVTNGGTLPSGTDAEFIKTYDETKILASPSKVGYEFDGWYSNMNLTTPYGGVGDISFEQGVTKYIYAKWNPISYTIRYNTNGGHLPSGINNTLTKTYDINVILASPSKMGYKFDYWCSDEELATVYDGNSDLSSTKNDIKDIYAKWTPVTYTIRYNTNGGTIPSGSDYVNKSFGEILNLASPSKAGYVFVGWCEDRSLLKPYYGDTDLTFVDGVTVNIYAKWAYAAYTIKYNTNGGTLPSGVRDSFTKIYNESKTLARPTKAGYLFESWYSEAELTNRYYGNTDLSTVSNVTKNIYAKWNPVTYTIRYHVNDGTLPSGTSDRFTKTYTVPITLARPSKQGYNFVGWYTVSGDISWYDGTTDLSKEQGAVKDIYAGWEAITYTIKYNVNGGTLPSGMSNSFTKSYGKLVELANPSRLGYIFGGWYSDSSFANLYDGTIDLTEVHGDTKNIYAKWTPITYTIKYNTNGGALPQGTSNSFTKTYDEPEVLTRPSKTGYIFTGWFSDVNLKTSYNGSTDISTVSNVTKNIYAKWSAITYTIRFDSNGVNAITPSEIIKTYGKDITLQKAKSKTSGSKFKAWYKEPTLQTVYDGTGLDLTTVNKDIVTLYAGFEEGSEMLHVYFNSNGGTGTMEPQAFNIGEKFQLNQNEFKKTGYVFNRWKSNTGVYYKNGETINYLTEDIYLTAEWIWKGGGGGDIGGGGGGGGGGRGGGRIAMDAAVLNVTYINQVKTITAIVDEKQAVWNYDPVLNKFKMNFTVGDVTIPAVNGFYTINKTVEQNVNEVSTNVASLETYYFDNEGNMVTGWIHTIDEKWYYMEHTKSLYEGKMFELGWKQIQNNWYYFLLDGSMLANSVTPDGYFVDSNGVWIQQ